MSAIRAACFLLVTSEMVTVTALLGIFGNARAQKGTAINKGVENSTDTLSVTTSSMFNKQPTYLFIYLNDDLLTLIINSI